MPSLWSILNLAYNRRLYLHPVTAIKVYRCYFNVAIWVEEDFMRQTTL